MRSTKSVPQRTFYKLLIRKLTLNITGVTGQNIPPAAVYLGVL